MQNNWPVKYLANQSKIVGVTLIWQKAVTVGKHNSYRPEMALFKFGGLKIIYQIARLNTPPIIQHIQCVHNWLITQKALPISASFVNSINIFRLCSPIKASFVNSNLFL